MIPAPHTLAAQLRGYAQARFTVRDVVGALRARQAADDPAWILRCDDAFVEAQLARLDARRPADLPLYGIPFAVKDNIDVAGLPTTAACPAFAYVAPRHATAVQRLLDAGAVLLGKTNLDQFATGLVGTRSPYGAVPNTFDPRYVSGGSSSGSASVVARGLAAFALGTDTAGSGRVPAGFNNIVGLKPTPGRVPMGGVVPACRTLDVVSVFALTAADAARVMAVMEGVADGEPVFQQPKLQRGWFPEPLRVAVPRRPDADAALGYDRAFEAALEHLGRLGAKVHTMDMEPLLEVARLLYDGPWVAERYAAAQPLLEQQPQALDPVVRGVIGQARGHDAVAAFRAQYRLRELAAQVAPLWQQADVLVVPTAPTMPTLAAVAAEPVLRNSELGRYTNFVNLLGWSALAVPAGFAAAGLPFGITFIAPGGSDAALAALGARWQAAVPLPLGARQGRSRGGEEAATDAETEAAPDDLFAAVLPRAAPSLPLAVVGAHLQGQPLHGQLVERGCRLLARTRTAPAYRLYALPGTTPPKPGLARVRGEAGARIEVEVYEMPQEALGSFLALIPAPLGLGSVELADGSWVKGFICEPFALQGAQDITTHGGWRAYLQSLAGPAKVDA
jgi:allophanate hydrolase